MDNSSDNEDEALWHHVTRDVEPLDKSTRNQSANIQPAPKKSKPSAPKPNQNTPKPQTTTQQAQGHEIDRRTAQKLGRGQMPIDARLDLHGMNQPEAHSALIRFIQNCYNTGQRHVLVITGKGRDRSQEAKSNGKEKEYGVLRKNVPYWLQESAISHLILETKTARREHGGEGALSILIRRNRSL